MYIDLLCVFILATLAGSVWSVHITSICAKRQVHKLCMYDPILKKSVCVCGLGGPSLVAYTYVRT